MRKVSKNALALACDTAELKIREELAQKIAQIRKEWNFVNVFCYSKIPKMVVFWMLFIEG